MTLFLLFPVFLTKIVRVVISKRVFLPLISENGERACTVRTPFGELASCHPLAMYLVCCPCLTVSRCAKYVSDRLLMSVNDPVFTLETSLFRESYG